MAKRKTKNNSKPKVRTQKAKHFEAHYLALILVGFLLLEGFLGTTTTMHDWQQGISVLDVSSTVSQTVSDMKVVFQPIADAIDGVNQFYAQAATQMAALLDLSDSDNFTEVNQVVDGVFQFYDQASVQMAQMLDMSSISSWSAHVAGVSIVAQ